MIVACVAEVNWENVQEFEWRAVVPTRSLRTAQDPLNPDKESDNVKRWPIMSYYVVVLYFLLVCLFASLFVCLLVYLLVCLFVYVFVCLFLCLFV